MKVILSLELCEGVAYQGKRELLFQDVEWSAVPPEKSVLTCGIRDGESTGFTASIDRVYWEPSGTVHVNCRADQLREEYDEILEDVKRDGFLSYDEWMKSR